MRYNTNAVRSLLLALFLLTLAVNTNHARPGVAPDDTRDDSQYDYDETARVARISLLTGDVSLRRAGKHKWERATLNFPLVEGDRLATGAGSRVEIQIDARNFVRVGEYATLDVVTLRAEGVALSLPAGTATLRLARFDHAKEYFEIDAPKTTIAAEQTGLYRLDVAQNGNVRVTTRDGARARLYSDTSGFTLRDGRTAELTYDNAGEGDWQFTAARDGDDWDTWVGDRERYLATRLRYDGRDRYYDQDIWGAEELDAYGDWVYARDYGYVWRPHIASINRYHDWAPYRYGHWVWCPPYGWTWVGDEAWGWAPYHYGRWVYYDNYWCWAPRGYDRYYSRHNWWRPALVAFIFVNNNSHVAWYPLGYHQHDPHARYYRQPERLSPLRPDQVGNLQRINPIYQRAVTSLPARDFGTGAVRAQPANNDIARNALNGDPVRGRLPIQPVDDNGDARTTRPALGERPRLGALADIGAGDAARRLSERPTGAGTRRPGVPLDAELQRGRIFNNRLPRDNTPDANNTDGNRDERNTGAVARPARPPRIVNPDANGNNNDTRTNTRPERPVRVDEENVRPRDPVINDRPERKRTVERPVEQPGDNERPQPDTRRERPAPPADQPDERRAMPRLERPERYERPDPPAERAAPPPREERAPPPQREERPQPREERHEERPSAPPPQREERSSPPPPREERSAPPPTREERHAEPARERESPTKDRPPLSR